MSQTGICVKLLLEHWSISGAKRNKTTGMFGLIPAVFWLYPALPAVARSSNSGTKSIFNFESLGVPVPPQLRMLTLIVRYLIKGLNPFNHLKLFEKIF